jgi:hypothetical protein
MAWLIDDPALAQKALCDLVGDETLLTLTVNDLDDAYCEWVSENSEDGQRYPGAWDALGTERQEELVERAKTLLGNLPWGDTLRSLFDAWSTGQKGISTEYLPTNLNEAKQLILSISEAEGRAGVLNNILARVSAVDAPKREKQQAARLVRQAGREIFPVRRTGQ